MPRPDGVSPQSARLAACVGTNLNNDGILLYEAMAVLFVAQVYGVDLTVGAAAPRRGIVRYRGDRDRGVPDAGLISLLIVLTTVGLPERDCRRDPAPADRRLGLSGDAGATTNVTSDMLVAVLLDKFEPPRSTRA